MRKILECLINEIKKDENVNYLKDSLINPAIKHVFEQMYPYILITIIIVILLLGLLICILVLLMNKN